MEIVVTGVRKKRCKRGLPKRNKKKEMEVKLVYSVCLLVNRKSIHTFFKQNGWQSDT